jgi:hypothetical protein
MQLRPTIPSLAIVALLATGITAQNKICSVFGGKQFDQFGAGVSGAGDVNKDGYPDFIVGGDEIGKIGFATVFSGKDGQVLLNLRGIDTNDTFGRAVGAAGDVNKDGYDDVIVGAPEDCG